MVQAIINIDDHTNRILNIIKAKYGLKDKSAAIIKMAEEYEDLILEPELKPEYVEKLKEIEKTEAREVGTVENLRKRYGL
jgi:Zn-dependent M32 family carboxypeptidase